MASKMVGNDANDVIAALSVSSLAMPGEKPPQDWEDGSLKA
jgi:hypothetical protein